MSETKGTAIYAEATELGIRGRSRMSLEELEAAVAEAKANGVGEQKAEERRVRAVAQPKKRDAFGDEIPDDDPPEQITEGDFRRIVTSSTVSLQKILGSDGLKECHRVAIEKVLRERREREEERKRAAMLRGPMVYWKVTRGGRFVAGGHATNMPEGAMVTSGSHNLDELRAQGASP